MPHRPRTLPLSTGAVMNRDDDLVVPGMLVHHEIERVLDDLRAKVEALRDEAGRNEHASDLANYETATFEYRAEREVLEKVLALIDGSGSGSS